MPIVVRHNETLELNLVEYRGAISWEELRELAIYGTAHADYLRRDALNWVLPGAHFRGVDFGRIDALFDHYRKLFEPLDFQIFRRSAWLCESPAGLEHVRYWLGGRNAREAMSSNVRDFTLLQDAGEWLLLNESEIPRVERREGFTHVVSYDIPATQAAAV